MPRLLALKAAFFFLLLPGTVAGFVPVGILRATGHFVPPGLSFASVAATALVLLGGALLVRCVWDFYRAGRGTLAPVDPPTVLVVTGLYRFTRNPMYNAVLTILLGQAWLFRSTALGLYALGFFAVVHLFVVCYEERDLEARFGGSYRAYRRAVPRWGFTLRPYSASRESSA